MAQAIVISKITIVSLVCSNIKFDPNKRCIISIKGYHGKYVGAHCHGNMRCDSDKILQYQLLECIPVKGVDGVFALKSYPGKYVCASPNGSLTHDRDKCDTVHMNIFG